MTEQVERYTLSEKELFQRLVNLETDKLTLAADIKAVKDDASYDSDLNPKGIQKDQIKLIAKAAVLHAKNVFEEQKEATDAVYQKYVELTDY